MYNIICNNIIHIIYNMYIYGIYNMIYIYIKYSESRIAKLLAQKKLPKWLQKICKMKCV